MLRSNFNAELTQHRIKNLIVPILGRDNSYLTVTAIMYANNDAFVDSGASRSLEYYELDAYNYTTEDSNEGNNEEGSFVVEPTEGMWSEHCALTYSNSPVTFLDYDSNQELLWA